MRTHVPILSGLGLPAFLATWVLLGLSASPSAQAGTCGDGTCTFSDCHTPAISRDPALWGELEPGFVGTLPVNRDTTDFDQVGDFEAHPYWLSLDVENGYVFTVAGRRLQIWNANANPGNPTSVFDEGFRDLNLTWTPDAHAFFIFEDIDAPPADDDIIALVGRYGVGMAVYDTTVKSSPVMKYQDYGIGNGRWGEEVYAATIGGRDYAFAVANQEGGVFAYDLTAAKALSGSCIEAQPSASSICPDVFLTQIGTRDRASAVDGTGPYVAIASGTSPKGLEIWDASNPASPSRVMNVLGSELVYGVAMWEEGANIYLAVRTLNQGRIYDVSCISGGTCSLGAPLWTKALAVASSGLVTFSRSDSTPFLYFGSSNDCQLGNQNEFLYDVSSPTAPRDITPPGTAVVSGESVSYWGWDYRRNGVHGFNRVAPRMGKFGGRMFFRAANAIFDTHRWVAPALPQANFSWNPTQVYPGTSVNFTDQSTGAPTAWSWDFLPDGSPGTSSLQNPTGVQFSTEGTKTVRLEASNLEGPDTRELTLDVLPPEPEITSVSASPNPALLCQPVSFMAEGVTGQPPLTFAWEVRESGAGTLVASGNGNPFIWNVDPGQDTTVTYTATATATNASGSAMQGSPAVTVEALPTLPGAGTFAPTYDGQPAPPTSATVQFHVAATGATEWNWNFGDNPGGGPNSDGYEGWTSDPVAGPNPMHSYTTIGTYDVQVKVRNCAEAERASSVLMVEIPDTEPLEAGFQASLFCVGGICSADINEQITFQDSSLGAPDFWDYDWDGNGSFEDAGNAFPVAFHTYTASKVHFPRLRIRRGPTQALFEDHLAINIGGYIPAPQVDVSGPREATPHQIVTFTVAIDDCRLYANGWTWNTDGGNGASTTGSIQIDWSGPGTRTVTASNSGCPGVTGTHVIQILDGDPIFLDGFETGDFSAWDIAIP